MSLFDGATNDVSHDRGAVRCNAEICGKRLFFFEFLSFSEMALAVFMLNSADGFLSKFVQVCNTSFLPLQAVTSHFLHLYLALLSSQTAKHLMKEEGNVLVLPLSRNSWIR